MRDPNFVGRIKRTFMFLVTCYEPSRPGHDRQTGSPTRGIPFRSEAQRCSTR